MDLVTIAPGHQLAPGPAASALRMFAAGCPAAITSSYRSTAEQQQLREAHLAGNGAFALPPGSSKHERGEAVDWKATAAAWVREHPEHGWRFTNPDEWWHTDYLAALDQHAHDLTPPAPAADTITLEDPDMTVIRYGGVPYSVTPLSIKPASETYAAVWSTITGRPVVDLDAKGYNAVVAQVQAHITDTAANLRAQGV